MSRTEKYRGIFPAFYACYDENGEISGERAKQFTRYLMEKKVQGLYVGGSSGECIYQSVEERKRLLESVMEAAEGKLVVIAHVACNNTKDSAELAAHAQELGVDAIASIPPIYFHLPEYAIAEYWNTISAAAPDTDFIIYNIPQLAGVSLTVPQMHFHAAARRSAQFRHPLLKRVIGVKNSSMPVQDIQQFLAAGGDDWVVFNGPDEQFVSGRAMGAAAGIGGTYAAMPELYLAMDKAFVEGRMEDARTLQYQANEIISALCSCRANMYAVIKEVLRMDGMDIGGVRAPLVNVTEEDLPKIQKCRAMIQEALAKRS